MNLSAKGASVANKKLSAEATLNPNAAEFVPFALRSQAANVRILDTSPKFTTSGKSVLDRSESSVSNSSNTEEEAQQYWCHQLPDDITPDFKVMGIDNDVNEASRYTSPTNSGFRLKEHQALSLHPLDGNTHAEKLRYPVSPNGECFQTSLAKPWDRQIRGGSDQLLAREGNPYSGNTSQAFLAEMSNEQSLLDNADLCRLEFLASQFPPFSAESIAEAYLSNGGDLNLTINVLSQLEMKPNCIKKQFNHEEVQKTIAKLGVDGGSNQTRSPMAFSSSNLSASKLPALCVPNGHSGSRKLAGDDQQNVSPYWSPGKDSSLRLRSFSTIPLRVATDFASAARKTTSQESSIWKYDRTGSSDTRQVLASAYNSAQAKSIYGNRLQSRGLPLTSPARLETGLSAANMYSEKREEARDHARVHNTYIEQARQAYLAGNKTLAKELSILGQLHSLQMKAANGEAQESVYHQRNSDISKTEQMIDLHGLNVSEAIFVLKRELAVLRNAARKVDQRVIVSIGVGADHHTRGSPTTPARLPVAVQRYLLEEEGLDYSEPRPGLLRVVIY